MFLRNLFKTKGEDSMYLLPIKFKEGDVVWVMNPRTGQPVQRTIEGVRTQLINSVQKTVYSFMKDYVANHGGYYDHLQYDPIPKEEQYFWVHESKIFRTKDELERSFNG